jgi:hypothetical protein
MRVEEFIKSLAETPDGAFFNPWFQVDPEHDISDQAPVIRARQLQTYLFERLSAATHLCIAEALGYQGGHFSGIAMTSERILLGHHASKSGVKPEHVFRSVEPQRTSKKEVNDKGMTEPTATIMWKALIQMGIDPYRVVLWNALPWHPYDPEDGLLSNRTPKDSELEYASKPLRNFLKLFPDREVIAVGRKAEHCLSELDIEHTGVRHPANGGAPKFRRQMKELMG